MLRSITLAPPHVTFRRLSTIRAAAAAATVAPPAPVGRRSLYEVLRVNRSASQSEIKKAYRALAKVYHPDATSSSDGCRDFVEIRDAYATLSDPDARAVYDSNSERQWWNSGSGRVVFRRWETDQCW